MRILKDVCLISLFTSWERWEGVNQIICASSLKFNTLKRQTRFFSPSLLHVGARWLGFCEGRRNCVSPLCDPPYFPPRERRECFWRRTASTSCHSAGVNSQSLGERRKYSDATWNPLLESKYWHHVGKNAPLKVKEVHWKFLKVKRSPCWRPKLWMYSHVESIIKICQITYRVIKLICLIMQGLEFIN